MRGTSQETVLPRLAGPAKAIGNMEIQVNSQKKPICDARAPRMKIWPNEIDDDHSKEVFQRFGHGKVVQF